MIKSGSIQVVFCFNLLSFLFSGMAEFSKTIDGENYINFY